MDILLSQILCCLFFLVAWLPTSVFCHTVILCLPHERDALLTVKNETLLGGGVAFPFLSWSGFNCCDWKGVRCSNLNSHVIQLHLSPSPFWLSKGDGWIGEYSDYWDTNGRARTRLSPSLLRLKYLEYLDVSYSELTGVIPTGFFELKYLKHLDLSLNSFEGEIPKGMASLLNLTYLNLYKAGFSGAVPSQLGNLSNLQFLDISNLHRYGYMYSQDVSGESKLEISNLNWVKKLQRLKYLSLGRVEVKMSTEKFGASLSHLSHLEYLDASFCGLWGSLPTSLLNLTSLAYLFLGGNMFSAQIPPWLGNMTSLYLLRVKGSNLIGPIPLSLSSLPNLRDLQLDYNPYLRGDIGEILDGQWRQLTALSLGFCGITGILPSSVGNISSLTSLSLPHTEIEGNIPSSLGNFSALETLDLEANSVSGPLPLSLSSLPNLRFLQLRDNPYLSGDIGQILHGHWRHLTTFSVGPSEITGILPSSIGNISSLTSLSLTNMAIEGSIPSSLGNLSALKTLDLASNSLQGDVSLDSFLNNTSLQYLSLSHNELTVRTNPLWIPTMYFQTISLASCNMGGTIPPFLSTQYRLQDLDLSSNNLVGSIPSWFEELKDLQRLNLSYNSLEGRLPSSFNVMQYEDLDLHKNSLVGPLPVPLGQSYLRVLDLSCNKFTGIIPKQIDVLLPGILFFSCSDNDLSGGIPPSIGNLQTLQVLDVSQNTLSGTIPRSIANCSSLKILNMANANLRGHIPSEMGSLLELQSLHLNGNMLGGILPHSLINCSELKILDAGNNFLSGKIPHWLSGFSKLMILILAANQFQGYIPPQLSNLSSLHVLDISNNRLTGSIPRDLGKLASMMDGNLNSSKSSDTLYYYKEVVQVTIKDLGLEYSSSVLLLITSIDLSGNLLSDEIPSEIGKLKGLHALNMSRNNLTGKIPLSFGMMKQLESLDVSCNKLQGSIPPDILQLSFLVFFNVSHNMFSGRIPAGGQFSTFNESFFVGNSGLCGFPLNKTCEPEKTAETIPEEEYEYEDGIPWHWYVEWMASFAAGFWGVFILIYVSQSWRRRLFQALDRVVVRLDGVLIRFMHRLTN